MEVICTLEVEMGVTNILVSGDGL